MATIKSYSDLQQSKKLAEILPLESADMCWCLATKGNPKAMFNEGYNEYGDFELPCWSLSALISIIPQELFYGEYIINITEGCDNRWVLTYDHHENRNHSYYSLSIGADNPVDACYKMIIRLHELNLL